MKLFADFILVSGIIVTFLMIFSLFKSQKKELPNQILTVILLLLLAEFISVYGMLHQIKQIFLFGFVFSDPSGYFIGPLLYIYIKSIYLKKEDLIKSHLLHFIPFSIYLIFITLPVSFSFIDEKPIFSYLKILEAYNFPDWEVLLQGTYLLVYLFASLKLLTKFTQTLKLNFSNLTEKDLNWIRRLLIGLFITICLDNFILILKFSFGEFSWEPGYLPIFAAIIMMFYLGYYGSFQSRVLIPAFILNEAPVAKNKTTSYPTVTINHLSNTNESEIKALKEKLLHVIQTEKPFLKEDLTLGMLAELIPTTDKKLSVLLNQYLNISFYDLINHHRIEEVKSKLTNPEFDNYTLLAIAYDSGFNSKTSFNRIFKKITGLSPSEYKKQFREAIK